MVMMDLIFLSPLLFYDVLTHRVNGRYADQCKGNDAYSKQCRNDLHGIYQKYGYPSFGDIFRKDVPLFQLTVSEISILSDLESPDQAVFRELIFRSQIADKSHIRIIPDQVTLHDGQSDSKPQPFPAEKQQFSFHP